MKFKVTNGILEEIINPETNVHIPVGVIKLGRDVFTSNNVTINVSFPATLVDCSECRALIFRYQENIYVDKNNPAFSSYNGVLYNKDQTILICCPMGKKGIYSTASTTKEIATNAFHSTTLDELILNEGLESIHRWAFTDICIKKPILIPRSILHISSKAFEGERSGVDLVVYLNSYAHHYAKKVNSVRYSCVLSDKIPIWDANIWKKNFLYAIETKDYNLLHDLRRKVFLSTLEIVKEGKYQLNNGEVVSLDLNDAIASKTKFYSEEIPEKNYPKRYNTQIAAINNDCLSYASKVCRIENEVCVLNMASRRNPGGGVLGGASAQEEYLFRCSDYYRSLYQFAPYATQYGVKRSEHSYPLDMNFGGIFTPNVTIFRKTEENGYSLLEKPWKVNMIAIAGLNRPSLIIEYGEERIDATLINRVKNKIRTIFRIAASNGQKTLILGALGCGAFKNPPKHIAELFHKVLCEQEFTNVFRRVFFVIKEDHNSHRTGNFKPFADVFGSLNPNSLIAPEGELFLKLTAESNKDTNIWDNMLRNRCTPEHITSLKKNEVFVFGTDPEGEHNSAAAKYAVEHFGASIGKGEGHVGQSYAIPIHRHRTEMMQAAIHRYIEYAAAHHDKIFLTLQVGCGKAGMNTLSVASMFKDAVNIENIYLPKSFILAIQYCDEKGLTSFHMHKGKLLHREMFAMNQYWSLYEDGTLEISGNGAMPDYTNHWNSYFGEGHPQWIGCEKYGVMPYRLVIDHGITYVGANAFESFESLKEVYLADTVIKLGNMAFYNCFNIQKINIPTYLNIVDFKKAELPMVYEKSFVQVDNWLILQMQDSINETD